MAEKINPRERARWMAGLGVRSGSAASMALGKRLQEWRDREGMTQLQAAKKAGVSDSIWATWETGRGLPGEQSWRRVVKTIGPEMTASIMEMVERVAREPGAGEPVARPAKAKAKRGPKPDGWGGWEPEAAETSKNEVRGADTDGVIGAVLACGLPDREKALLCAAVIAMAAGVKVEVEIRAAV